VYEIVAKEELVQGYKLITIAAPLVAAKIKAGQFVILRIHEKGERIPISICDHDTGKGHISTVVHEVGKTTKEFGKLKPGDKITNVCGPLGKPSAVKKYGRVVLVCRGGTAAAIFPIARELKKKCNHITTIIGAKTKEFIIFEDRLRECSDELLIATDDGTEGRKGYAVHVLRDFLHEHRADLIIAIGPTIMMKTAAKIAREHGIRAIASLGAIMVDGTGMCGACRVTVGSKTKFACVHGPEFNAHEVDFDELKRRQQMYQEEEKVALEAFEKDEAEP